jgi:cbb3-type cytochrome oxidase subunit 3
MEYLKIMTVVTLFVASIIMLFWVFRPGSKKFYDSCSLIPLQNDKATNDEDWG